MKRIFTFILILIAGFISAYSLVSYANVDIPGTFKIETASIGASLTSGSIDGLKTFGFQLLGIMRMAVAWIALVYLVMIGVYMVIGSDSEETIKTQRKQITYALIGFLFLNIPSFVYTIFFPENVSGSIDGITNWSSVYGWFFWDAAWFEGIVWNIIAFLKVFIFGAAVTMFTWWLFNLILSGGDDEKKKKATNRIIYWVLGLIFVGFVDLWWNLVAEGDFTNYIPSIARSLFKLALFFAAPVVIFMLFYGAYYYITSAGDDDRMKKWKSIVINTGIAVIILIAALSFLTDLITFKL